MAKLTGPQVSVLKRHARFMAEWEPRRAELVTLYVEGPLSQRAVAERYGVEAVTVQRALRVLGLPSKSRGRKGARGHAPPPVPEQWLRQQYVDAGLSTYDIGKLIGYDPKTIHKWLRDLGIPTRERPWANTATGRRHQDETWLREQYVSRQRSSAEIGTECGVTLETILFWLDRFGIARRSISEARGVKKWGLVGEANGMYGRRGAESVNWRGGVTPERQAVYSSPEWAAAVLAVRVRDRGVCRRCGAKPSGRLQARRFFHIHHVVSFAVRELRCEPDNLVLLCRPCHLFVHSRRNTAAEFIREGGEAK